MIQSDFLGGLESPLGWITITASANGITSVSLHQEQREPVTNNVIQQASNQLCAYFEGKLQEFSIPLDLSGYSEFYQRVWKHLLDIPYGTTKSYLDIAKRMGDENSVRAVGMANGKNPIAIIVPCHRVIGSNGKLVGYAGGLESKQWLLTHELAHRPVPEHLLF